MVTLQHNGSIVLGTPGALFMRNSYSIDLTFRGGGSYFTAIPVSPLSYRKDHPTHAHALVVKVRKGKRVEITDDHGSLFVLRFEDEDEAAYLRTIDLLQQEELLK
jgi:hypothetical protein